MVRYTMELQWSDGVMRPDPNLADVEETDELLTFTWLNDCNGLCRITVMKGDLHD